MASKPHLVPFVEGYVPGTPKPKKEKFWVDELNEIGNFLLGPHGSQLFGGLEAAAEFTPGAAVRDTMDASKTVSEGVMNLNPWETGMGLAGILMGILPGKSKLTEFPLIHGTRHEFAPTEKNPLGEFDMKKILTGEGANYEGKGIYATEPKAEGLATSYAHLKTSGTPDVTIGNTSLTNKIIDLDSKIADINISLADHSFDMGNPDTEKKLYAELDKLMDTENTLSKFVKSIIDRSDSFLSDSSKFDKFLDNWLDYYKVKENPELTNLLKSLSGPVNIREPGGFVYDFKVKDNPDNFINMHLPLQYQDDKIIQAVDTWLKEMPISKKQMLEQIDTYGKYSEQETRDYLRRKFIDDEYKIPKEDMSRILQNEFMNEHMDIIKDQGVLGQKWFGRHKDGGRHRSDVDKLFKDLAVVDNATKDNIDGLDIRRKDIEKKIYDLETKMETMSLSDDNIPFMHLMQSEINRLNSRLMNMQGPEDIQEKLWKIYNDPNLAYNYTINDTSKTDIMNRRFKPR